MRNAFNGRPILAKRASPVQDGLFYLREHFNNPTFQSVWPSSHRTVERLTQHLELGRAELGAELGPATGVLTQELLRGMPKSSQLITFETDQPSCVTLERRFGSDRRVQIVKKSAEYLQRQLSQRAFGPASFIISGIPFSKLGSEAATSVIHQCYNALKGGGDFVVYQCLLPGSKQENRIVNLLTDHFGEGNVELDRSLRNLPPLRIYVSRKQAL